MTPSIMRPLSASLCAICLLSVAPPLSAQAAEDWLLFSVRQGARN